MKSLAAGSASGCLVWLIVFGALTLCLCPAAMFVASFSSTLAADSVARFMEPFLCPAGSTAEIITYQTTIPDDAGGTSPATAFEMQCVDASGQIVRAPSPDYAFYWIGLLAIASLAVAALLALLLAAPAGALIARFTHRGAAATNA
jgi:hypothetical protein